VPIPFNITLLKFSNETVLFDAGTGGQFQPTAGAMIANMAAGIKPSQITKVIVSHFYPDHVFGLMSSPRHAQLDIDPDLAETTRADCSTVPCPKRRLLPATTSRSQPLVRSCGTTQVIPSRLPHN
jgi:glyoxylase-like metal-dependent hydrolase (beta-lactamase superfamily II)